MKSKKNKIEAWESGILVEAPKELTDKLVEDGFVFYTDDDGKVITKEEYDILREEYLSQTKGGKGE